MRKRFALISIVLVVALVGPAVTGSAHAGLMLQPLGVSSPPPLGDPGFPDPRFALINITNQSGLVPGYTSGVDDFATYTASAVHFSTYVGVDPSNSGFTNRDLLNTPGGQVITFDLGASPTVDAIALWAVDHVFAVAQFQLFADDNIDPFDAITGPLGGTFNANAVAGAGSVTSAQVFSFPATTTPFVHMLVLSTQLGASGFPGIGDLAFSATTSSPPPVNGVVPEPSSLALLGIASFGLVGYVYRRRNR